VTGESLSDALRRTIALFGQKDVWRQIQQQGMRADFSWKRVGARYAELYRKTVGQAPA
jgi:starch synthase